MMLTFVEQPMAVGETTTTHPEHPASGKRQRTIVARRFMTLSEAMDLTPRRVAGQVGLFRAARVGRRNVLQDEELFTRLDETEFAAGEILDRGRVFLQAPGLLAQSRVVGTNIDQRLLERPVLLTLLQHL